MRDNSADKTRNHWSIRTKVDMVLVALSMVMLATSVACQYASQRDMAEEVARHQAGALADSYFGNINNLILTVVIANHDIPRKKVMSRFEVLDARVVRNAEVKDQFGPGPDTGRPVDDFDRRGIAGEEIEQLHPVRGGRVLTAVRPLRARTDFRGTNCLGCHAVNTATRMNEQIAGAAHEQSTVGSETNRNVAGISEVTDHTAHSAEQIAQVSDRLCGLAANLKNMVERFHT